MPLVAFLLHVQHTFEHYELFDPHVLALVEDYADSVADHARDVLKRVHGIPSNLISDQTLLCFNPDHEVLRLLLRIPSVRALANCRDESGGSPIHDAIVKGDLENVRSFLRTNAVETLGDWSYPGWRKDTNVFHLAAYSGNTELVELLLARPELKGMHRLHSTVDGKAPLHYARGRAIEALLRTDAFEDLATTTFSGMTPRDVARADNRLSEFDDAICRVRLVPQ
jgi:ankyrin repeat protein